MVSTIGSTTVRKKVSCVESQIEYYRELRSKNAQNNKALTYPLYGY